MAALESAPAAPDVTVDPERRTQAAEKLPRARRPVHWGNILGLTVGLVGVAAIAATAFTYAETRREIVRLSTDIAQLRLTLDLTAQQRNAPAPASASTGVDPEAVAALENRIAVLEESWRTAPAVAAPTASAAPSLTGAAVSDDCLPAGTRFLVTTGDVWPVCGTTAIVEVASVEPGYLTLLDGSVVASGGNFPLVGTNCLLGVLSAGTADLSTYAEIRVTC